MFVTLVRMFHHTTIKISVKSHKGEYLPVSEIFRKVIGIVTNVLYEALLDEASFIVVSFLRVISQCTRRRSTELVELFSSQCSNHSKSRAQGKDVLNRHAIV